MKSAILRLSFSLLLTVSLVSISFASAASDAKPGDDGWISLFNGKDFSGWYTYLDSNGRNKDPKGVFKIENGMIHILDVPMSEGKADNGYLATIQDYSNVRIHAEYKWGVNELTKASGIAGCSILLSALTQSIRHPWSVRLRKLTLAICGLLTVRQSPRFSLRRPCRCSMTICRPAPASAALPATPVAF